MVTFNPQEVKIQLEGNKYTVVLTGAREIFSFSMSPFMAHQVGRLILETVLQDFPE